MPQAASAPVVTNQFIESLTIEMHLTKNLLYRTFNVLGLLAAKAGQIKITVGAEGLSGLDPIWVRDAIKEPLSEANIPDQRVTPRAVCDRLYGSWISACAGMTGCRHTREGGHPVS